MTQALKGKLHYHFHLLPAGPKASVSLFSASLSRQITLIFHQRESCDDIAVATLFADADNLDRPDGPFSFASKAKGGIRHTAEHIKLAFLFLLF